MYKALKGQPGGRNNLIQEILARAHEQPALRSGEWKYDTIFHRLRNELKKAKIGGDTYFAQ